MGYRLLSSSWNGNNVGRLWGENGDIICVNYKDLTRTEPWNHGSEGNHPQLALIQSFTQMSWFQYHAWGIIMKYNGVSWKSVMEIGNHGIYWERTGYDDVQIYGGILCHWDVLEAPNHPVFMDDRELALERARVIWWLWIHIDLRNPHLCIYILHSIFAGSLFNHEWYNIYTV